MKKNLYFGLALLLISGMFLTPALADHQGKSCSLGENGCSHAGQCKDGSDSKCPITNKIMKKAKFFIKNSKEIGLSEEQISQIKAIKTAAKKSSIRAEAEMEIFELDMDEKLSQPKIDTEGLNAMMDQASTGWAAGAKAMIADYVKLKAVLNEQQYAKAKEIWMKDSR